VRTFDKRASRVPLSGAFSHQNFDFHFGISNNRRPLRIISRAKVEEGLKVRSSFAEFLEITFQRF
jgi:hypothetical protein